MSAHVGDRGVTPTVVTHPGSDMRAAFTGLIAGVIALLIIVVAIVFLTNRSFAGHEGAPAAGSHGTATPGTPH